MSKVDAMRALREARRAAVTAAPPAPASRAAARPAAPSSRAAATAVTPAVVASGDAVCGHRNMSGRSCTRELDHVENGTKNHRYG